MLAQKYEQAAALLEEHNAVLGDDESLTVDPNEFLTCIKALGGTSEDRLKRFRYEDILQCLPEANGIKPTVLARDLANVFRGREDGAERRPVSSAKAERMTPRELVAHYDPQDPEAPVAKRLKEISRGEPFVVFAGLDHIDLETTVQLLLEVKKGYEGRSEAEADGQIKAVYRVGDVPVLMVDENPLYPGRPLRPGEECDQTGRSWDGIDQTVRQLIRVAVEIGEIRVNIETAHHVMDLALEQDAEQTLRSRYCKAAVAFDERKETDQLPSLKVPLKGSTYGQHRPFAQGKKISF